MCRRHAHRGIQRHQLGNCVGAQNFGGRLRLHGSHAFAVGAKHAGHVRQVQFSLRIVSSQLPKMSLQCRSLERVDPGVDLAQRHLLRRQRLLFDNRLYLRRFRSAPHNPPVARGILRGCGQNRHRGAFSLMEAPQPLDGLGPDQRDIP